MNQKRVHEVVFFIERDLRSIPKDKGGVGKEYDLDGGSIGERGGRAVWESQSVTVTVGTTRVYPLRETQPARRGKVLLVANCDDILLRQEERGEKAHPTGPRTDVRQGRENRDVWRW